MSKTSFKAQDKRSSSVGLELQLPTFIITIDIHEIISIHIIYFHQNLMLAAMEKLRLFNSSYQMDHLIIMFSC